VRQQTFLSVKDLVFSPNNEHIAYVATIREGTELKHRLVVDGEETGKKYDGISTPFFSVDGRLAFVVRNANKSFVVLDGVEGRAYDTVGWQRFSPDGRHLGYWAALGTGKSDRRRMVVDDKEGDEFWAVSEPVFSPDGRRAAYRACLDRPKLADMTIEPRKLQQQLDRAIYCVQP
jgi:hypothetical protein